MTEPMPSTPSDQSDGTAEPRASWWQRNHRRFWLWLAFLVAVTAPFWGGLILLWLFSPSSPFPKG